MCGRPWNSWQGLGDAWRKPGLGLSWDDLAASSYRAIRRARLKVEIPIWCPVELRHPAGTVTASSTARRQVRRCWACRVGRDTSLCGGRSPDCPPSDDGNRVEPKPGGRAGKMPSFLRAGGESSSSGGSEHRGWSLGCAISG